MPKVTLDLPEVALQDEQLNLRPLGDADTLARELRLAAALFWFERGMISGGKAAEVAGVTRHEFMLACGSARINVLQVDMADLRPTPASDDEEGDDGARA